MQKRSQIHPKSVNIQAKSVPNEVLEPCGKDLAPKCIPRGSKMKTLWNFVRFRAPFWRSKSIKNLSNINQTWTNKQSKIVNNRGLEGSSAGLEASWAVLGDPKRLWRHLGLSWKRLGGVLERSWRPLGRFSPEKGGQHGSNMASKTEPKSITNRSQDWSIF